jgi:hypothetical protein
MVRRRSASYHNEQRTPGDRDIVREVLSGVFTLHVFSIRQDGARD